jgi:hypothetical protein
MPNAEDTTTALAQCCHYGFLLQPHLPTCPTMEALDLYYNAYLTHSPGTRHCLRPCSYSMCPPPPSDTGLAGSLNRGSLEKFVLILPGWP